MGKLRLSFWKSIQGEGGVHPAKGEYLRAVRRLCDERGALVDHR